MRQRQGDADAPWRVSRMTSLWQAVPRRAGRGQALAEFAIILPVLIAIIGGIIQFGMIFWAQNSLTQVVRDTGRWVSTQQYGANQPPGTDYCTGNEAGVVKEADSVATNSFLLGYTSGTWTTTGPISMTSTSEGVSVTWEDMTSPKKASDTCSPPDNSQVWIATIKINHSVPTFLPGMQFLPGIGSNGQVMLSSTAQFRMEPAP